MKLLTTHRIDDFGPEFRLALLEGRRFSLLQSSVSWSDYGSLSPYLQLSFGNNSIFSLFFYVGRLTVDLDFLGRTWRPLDEPTPSVPSVSSVPL